MLTESQHKALSFIRNYIVTKGYSPSFADIAEGLGLKSRGVVHRHVHALADSGYIELIPGRQRNIKLKDDTGGTGIPYLGQIAAGQPIEAIEDADNIDPTSELTGNNRFALKVKGDSMVDAGILDGDIVVIQQQQMANDGDIVVALVDSCDVTLKRLKKLNNGNVELIPENSTMKPMTYPDSQVKIQGVLVGQFRIYN